MNRSRMLVAGAVFGVLAVVGATLGVMKFLDHREAEADRQAVAEKSNSAAAAASSAAAAAASASAKAEAVQQERHDDCDALTSPLSEALREVDSRLAVGLSYNEYGDYLGTVQVKYDNMARQMQDPKSQDSACIDVGIELENAFNAYVKVKNIWGACIDDYKCDFSTGRTNTKAQLGWARATDHLDKADKALADMLPD